MCNPPLTGVSLQLALQEPMHSPSSLLPLFFIISSFSNTLSLAFLPHPFSICFSLPLSSLPLSDVMPLCQRGGARGERRNESGSQEAMHLKSPLCHNKKEIDLWLACSPIPFGLKRRPTDR